jgi:hypothetical protein
LFIFMFMCDFAVLISTNNLQTMDIDMDLDKDTNKDTDKE